MKVINVLNSPNWSGASQYCVTLCDYLQRKGHKILLLTEPGKPLDIALTHGISCDDTIRLNHRNPYLYMHAIKRMAKIFKEFDPDIVSSHINEGAWMTGLVSRKVSPKAVIVRTRSDIDPPKGHFINKFVYRHWTDHIIVSSLLHKRICRNILDFPPESIDVVYGSVDVNLFRPNHFYGTAFRSEIGVKPETVLIGMVGRLDPVKGHEFALEALKALSGCGVSKKLLVLAFENQRSFSWLKNLAAKLGVINDLHFFGYRNDLPQVLSSIDLGLITSTGSEANCRVALEFMASGIPVVATSVGVIPEIMIDGEHGFLVPPKDSIALATALSRLLTNPYIRLKMGNSARKHVEANFNPDLFAMRTEMVYKKALSCHSRNSP
ncbi:glycosyltransferase family 4 protein [bacterium]|nr:glycosyltransferase family 4 protein [bacterium]